MFLVTKAPMPFFKEGLTSKYSVVKRVEDGTEGDEGGVEDGEEEDEPADIDCRKAFGERAGSSDKLSLLHATRFSDREAALRCLGLST